MKHLLPALFLLLTTLAYAQPPHKIGCHYFRSQEAARMQPLTDKQLAQIEEVIARSDTFDILHYDIAIDVTDVANERISAATTITFSPLMSGQTFIRFELFQLTVDSVMVNNALVPFSHDGEILKVDLPFVPDVGTDYELTVHYQGTPHRDPGWGGFYFEQGYIYNLGIGLTTIPPNFGKVWYPCFDSFVERATYTYHVKSSGAYRAHCQGDFMGEVQLGGDTVVRSFSLSRAIPTHLSAIAVSNYQDSTWTHVGAYGNYPITLTAKPGQLNSMVNKMVNVADAIDACEHWYGPYGWGRVGYVMTTDGALEIPTNIAFPDFMPAQPISSNRSLLSHELGHLWWGDVVTPYTHNDMWLKEGPAEYSGHLVEEWIGGRDALVEAVKDNMLFVLRSAYIEDDGHQPLSGIPDAHIYGEHTYYKGAAVLHNLRAYLGDSLFRQGMTTVQVTQSDQALTAAQFRDALEAATGKDLDAFFDAWVFTPGYSVFVVQTMNASNTGGQWEVDLLLRQRLRAAPNFHGDVPLDLTLVSATGQRQEYQVMADGEFTPVNVPCDFEPAMAILNGHARLNQARMDHEFTVPPNGNFFSILPYVDFRIDDVAIPDSTLIRVEHIWAGPDQDAVEWGVYEISSSHYWIVDGLWPQGTQLEGKVYYNGSDPTDLDFDLFGGNELDATLVYRETASDPWSIYPDLTINTGSLTDGVGNMDMNVLRKGQYAFAKGDAVAGWTEAAAQAPGVLQLFPVPADQALSVRSSKAFEGTAFLDVFDGEGALVLRRTARLNKNALVTIDMSDVPTGAYVLLARDASGQVIDRRPFEVVR
ncbi:MAG: hypothetical protein KDB88_02250 [Flavobacteriales bacterium]|nr:hypothetical protein [Flavobacteriales bacterium]